MRVSTASVKEKVRYVAFDKLGHKLITGITNSPQTRWERVSHVPVSVSMAVPPMPMPMPAAPMPMPMRGPCPRRLARRIVAPRFNWPAFNNNNNNTTNNNVNNTEPTVSYNS